MTPRQLSLLAGVERSATFSPDGRYRYTLTRTWDDEGRSLLWVMLNPSTADADADDPTVRRCVAFSQRWGYGSLTICNLFAWRATRPAELRRADVEPIGPDNVATLDRELAAHARAVVAWGAWSGAVKPPPIQAMAALHNTTLWCLGTTAQGRPRHPLYVRGDTPTSSWPPPVVEDV